MNRSLSINRFDEGKGNKAKDERIFLKSIFCILVFFIFLFNSKFFKNIDFLSCVLLIINLCAFFIAYSIDTTKNFTLYKTSLLFILIFLILAPASQIANNYYPWNYTVELKERHIAFVVVFFWIFSLLMVKVIAKPSKKKNKQYKKVLSNHPMVLVALFLLLIVDVIALQLFSGFQNVFIRMAFYFNAGTPFDIAIDFLLKSFPILFLAIMRTDKTIMKKHKILFALVLLYAALINNPISHSRFLSMSVYLGLFFIVFPRLLSWKYIDLLFVFGICVLFPLASQFKFSSQIDLKSFELSTVFLSVDYDAFALMEQGIIFHEKYGLCNGTQIISSIFFFVPRSILPIKGTPSGQLIIDALHPGSFNNVSCPLLVEGLLDFGVVGVVLYGFFFSFVTIMLDYKYIYSNKRSVFCTLYPFLFGYWIYMMRGSLAPTILRFFGFILPFLLYSVMNKFYRLGTSNECAWEKKIGYHE